MTTGHTLMKKALPLTAVLIAALVLVGALLAGCGDDTSTQEETQAVNDSNSLINTIIVSGNGKVTTLPDEATIQVGRRERRGDGGRGSGRELQGHAEGP